MAALGRRVARGGRHAWGCGRSAHAPPTQIHGRFRPTYFHPGLLQRPRPVRRRDGAAPPRCGPSQGARAGAHCAGAVCVGGVPSRGRGGGHGPERVRGDAQPSLRPQRGLGPRCKRRPSTGEWPPFRPRPPPGTARALGGGATPGAHLVALGRSSHLSPPSGEATCRGAPPLAFPSGARAPCVPHGRRPHPFVELPGCLVVRALRPIRPGEELCLSYVETSLPTAERKAHLLAHFGFECGCTRCAKE